MSDKVVPLQRHSLTQILDEMREMGPNARGVLCVVLKPDGDAHFRISGFSKRGDMFTVCGLLDWVKADLLVDILEYAEKL